VDDQFGTHTVVRGPSITSSVHASEEIRAAAATYRARGAPGDADVADRLEEAARNVATRASVWQLAGYSAQEQTQLAEFWWRNELAIREYYAPNRIGNNETNRSRQRLATIPVVNTPARTSANPRPPKALVRPKPGAAYKKD
jgi:hypothetical protein